MSVLDDILRRKREEVEARRTAEPEALLRARAEAAPRPRDFLGAFRGAPPARSGLRVIAEFKRASPSRGPIRPGADPAEIAGAYQAAGAAALSVLTDGPSFDGSLSDLRIARAAVELPVLRKDFIIDRYQLLEARAAGADAVLLIAAALDDGSLLELRRAARELGMASLVEVHDRQEMERARRLDCELVGINNRDLRTLLVSLETTRALAGLRPERALLLSESGFQTREEMEEMRGWGVDGFLVGESLMRAADPGSALAAITGGPSGGAGAGSPQVKICGITRYEDARLALELGAWALGLNFYPRSPRYLPPERAAALVRKLPPGALAVGVFVDAPLEEVNGLVQSLGLGGVQLHGSETPDYAASVRAPLVIKSFAAGKGFRLEQIGRYPGARVLLDAQVEGLQGGTGRTCDWAVAREAQMRFPIILAGGLDPRNVEEALDRVRPAGIDLAGGVESRPGEKDPEKLRRLFGALRRWRGAPRETSQARTTRDSTVR